MYVLLLCMLTVEFLHALTINNCMFNFAVIKKEFQTGEMAWSMLDMDHAYCKNYNRLNCKKHRVKHSIRYKCKTCAAICAHYVIVAAEYVD